jgi:hypothetical protein
MKFKPSVQEMKKSWLTITIKTQEAQKFIAMASKMPILTVLLQITHSMIIKRPNPKILK